MTNVEELIELLSEDVIPDIEDYMDELFAIIADKKADATDAKEELEDIREMHSDFKGMLEEAQNGEIDEDEAKEIIDEIHEMMGGEGEEA